MTTTGTDASASKSSTDRLQRWSTIADIFSKLVIGAAVTLYGIYLAKTKDDADRANQCSAATRSIFEAAQKREYPGDVLNEMVHWIPVHCDLDRGHFVQVLTALSSSPEAAETTALPPSSAGGGPGPGPGPRTGNNSTGPDKPTDEALKGWVAVGFLNSDLNFSLDNGQPLTTAPIRNMVLRARWQVSVRPVAADWRNAVGVLGAAQCFRIDESKALSAGRQSQIWARGEAAPCP